METEKNWWWKYQGLNWMLYSDVRYYYVVFLCVHSPKLWIRRGSPSSSTRVSGVRMTPGPGWGPMPTPGGAVPTTMTAGPPLLLSLSSTTTGDSMLVRMRQWLCVVVVMMNNCFLLLWETHFVTHLQQLYSACAMLCIDQSCIQCNQ